MKLTLDEKLKMCKEHIEEGKTLSHVCEKHNKPKYYSSYKGNLGGVVNNVINRDFITKKAI